MTCSERSLGSASSSSARRTSSSGVFPRGRDPAMGWVMARSPVTLTSASGLLPTTSYAEPSGCGSRKRYMYGLGLRARSAR